MHVGYTKLKRIQAPFSPLGKRMSYIGFLLSWSKPAFFQSLETLRTRNYKNTLANVRGCIWVSRIDPWWTSRQWTKGSVLGRWLRSGERVDVEVDAVELHGWAVPQSLLTQVTCPQVQPLFLSNSWAWLKPHEHSDQMSSSNGPWDSWHNQLHLAWNCPCYMLVPPSRIVSHPFVYTCLHQNGGYMWIYPEC